MFSFFKKKNTTPAELAFHTDIHCHIVPGVDDGAKDPVKAADLVERMQAWGIRRIIASPHVTQYTFENDLSTLTPAIEALRAELQQRNNPIDLTHAAEYRIDELFMQRLDNNELMLLPEGRILIENSFLQEPWNLDQLVFDLQVKGLKPILAHPERYAYYGSRKDRLAELHSAGLSFQINLLSLAEAYGRAEKKMAEYIIGKGYADYVGTDLHRADQADVVDSYLLTSDARAHMADLAATIRNDKDFPAKA